MIVMLETSNRIARLSLTIDRKQVVEDSMLKRCWQSRPLSSNQVPKLGMAASRGSVAEEVGFDADLLHLTIQGRAPYAELARHLRHLAVIVVQREADGVGLDLLQFAHIAA